MTTGGNDRASVYSSAEKLKQPDAMFDGELAGLSCRLKMGIGHRTWDFGGEEWTWRKAPF